MGQIALRLFLLLPVQIKTPPNAISVFIEPNVVYYVEF